MLHLHNKWTLCTRGGHLTSNHRIIWEFPCPTTQGLSLTSFDLERQDYLLQYACHFSRQVNWTSLPDHTQGFLLQRTEKARLRQTEEVQYPPFQGGENKEAKVHKTPNTCSHSTHQFKHSRLWLVDKKYSGVLPVQSNKEIFTNQRLSYKVKLSLCLTKHHAMKTYWGSGGIAPRILWPRH
jgi:hypothetical protein